MKRLSETALEKSQDVIKKIKEHSFNVELANGILDKAKFSYYIEQDSLYLKDFGRSLAIIGGRVPAEFMKDFLSFSEGALIAEQELVHGYFREIFKIKNTGKLAPATLYYTDFLMHVSVLAPVEVAVASILPCFWVYQIVGQSILSNTRSDITNPFSKWIETYSSVEFSSVVNKVIAIFDELAMNVNDNIQSEMLLAFRKSTILEWHFWNDSYNMRDFDTLL